MFLSTCICINGMEIKENKPSVATLKCLQGIKDFNKTMVKEAFSEGADINYVDENGNSLFSLAADLAAGIHNRNIIKKNMSILKLVVSQKNIDPFTRNLNNCTPLHIACQFGIIDTIKEILKKAPAVLTYQTKLGFTPLHTAVYLDQIEAINLLLSHDKKIINAQDYEGETPLHMACAERDFNIISLLIDNGACTTIKSNSQQTPLYILHSVCFAQDYPVDTLSSEKLEMFLKDNPFIVEKLIHATDEHNNNQFHLCTTLNLDGYRVFQRYLHFLVAKKISMHSRNKDGKRPIDLI